MHFTFRPMNEQDAHAIAAWHYEPPYDFYDMSQDPEDLAELLNPHSWAQSYYTVVGEQGELVGFFTFKRGTGDILEIGLGLRPDLTGQGLGSAFLEAGLSFAREKFTISRFSLSVATFNKRAIRTYERAGFKPLRTFMQQTNGSEF